MAQDRHSGAEANRYGREVARAIANRLGTSCPNKNSNECVYKGKRVVIKCAHANTQDIGVTYRMLERIDKVIAAFEQDSGAYRLYCLTPAQFGKNMRPTASRGPAAGRVGLVRKSVFLEKSQFLAAISI